MRAVAVLAVVFFHAGWEVFEGGYVGVDVFFVISGFLITQLIMKDLEKGVFSIARFYERRIRRIFPAFFALAFFVVLAGAWLYNQENFLALTESVFAATLSWANLLFWSQAGYWDGPSLLKPMLHTWSLSVEEQFYVVYPLTLYVLARFWKNRITSILWGLLALSFGFNVYVLQYDPNSAFYLPYLRAWELLLGGLIAIRPVALTQKLNEASSLFGLGIIFYSIFSFDAETPFPGLMAVLPVFGSGLVINAGVSGDTLAGRLLRIKPLVAVGKISYSLYLWHWPLLVFGKYYLIRIATGWELALLLCVALAISIISWWLVETPFRDTRFLSRRQLFVFAGVIGLVLVAINQVNIAYQGFPQRYIGRNIIPSTEFNAGNNKWNQCTGGKEYCVIGETNGSPSFLLFGDSHARSIAPGIDAAAKRYHLSGYYIYWEGCVPLLGVDKIRSGVAMDEGCALQKRAIASFLKKNPGISRVIISSRWAINYTGTVYKTEGSGVVTLVSEDKQNVQLSQSQLFYIGLKNMIADVDASGEKIYIVLGIPEVGYNVPSAQFIGQLTRRDINQIIAPTKTEYLQRNQGVLQVMQKIQQEFPSVTLIDPASPLCNNEQQICIVKDNKNYPLYRDDDHLSTYGALYISPIFDEIFQK